MMGRSRWVFGLSALLFLSASGCGGKASKYVMGMADGTAGADDGNAGAAGANNAGPLYLEAWGGPAGKVAADVPLVDGRVGPQEACDAPLVDGDCQLTTCVSGGIASPAPGGGNFGPITASIDTVTIDLSYDRFGYPTVYFPPAIALGTGGIMTFRGGGTLGVPPFDVAVTIPGAADLTSPLPAAEGEPAAIDTSKDLSVAWLPISVGQILFNITANDDEGDRKAMHLTCKFDGAAGTGVISSALLAPMKEVSATVRSYASAGSSLEATTTIKGFSIIAHSSQSSTSQQSFEVTLQ